MGRQHQGMDRPGVRQVPEGSGEQGKNGKKKNGCKIICAAPTTLAVKGLMMMMMMTTDILGSQQIHRQVCENSTLQNEAIGIILKTSKDTPTGTLRFMQYLLPMQTRQNVEQVCWQTELKQFMEFENTKTYSVTSMRRSCQVFWMKKKKKIVENSMQVSRFRNQASHSRRHRIKGSHSLH